jgi:hypothetical protein
MRRFDEGILALWAAYLLLAMPRLAAAICSGVQFSTANNIISTGYNGGGVSFNPTLDNVLPVRNLKAAPLGPECAASLPCVGMCLPHCACLLLAQAYTLYIRARMPGRKVWQR